MANYTLSKTGAEIDNLLDIVDDAPNNSITSGSVELVTSGTIHTYIGTVSGSFTTSDNKTITITNGVVTAITSN